MANEAAPADYSLEISIARDFSLDGAARCKRSYNFRNLGTTPLAIDFPISFELSDKNVSASNLASQSDGHDLPVTTSSEGGWIRISAQPNVTIEPLATWSLDFIYTNPYQADYVTSLAMWLCHERWLFHGSPVGAPRESTPRRYHYSARVLDGRRKLLSIPIRLQTLEAYGVPERQILSARKYLEMTWDFNVQESRPFELTVMFAQRPWKYRPWLIGVGASLAAAATTAVTGVEIALPF